MARSKRQTIGDQVLKQTMGDQELEYYTLLFSEPNVVRPGGSGDMSNFPNYDAVFSRWNSRARALVQNPYFYTSPGDGFIILVYHLDEGGWTKGVVSASDHCDDDCGPGEICFMVWDIAWGESCGDSLAEAAVYPALCRHANVLRKTTTTTTTTTTTKPSHARKRAVLPTA